MDDNYYLFIVCWVVLFDTIEFMILKQLNASSLY